MMWGEFNWIESSWMNWMRENEANNSVDKLLLDRRHRFAVSKDSPISVDLQLFRILLLAIAVSNVARILYHFQDFSEFFEIFSIFLMERNFWNFSGFWDSGILWGFFFKIQSINNPRSSVDNKRQQSDDRGNDPFPAENKMAIDCAKCCVKMANSLPFSSNRHLPSLSIHPIRFLNFFILLQNWPNLQLSRFLRIERNGIDWPWHRKLQFPNQFWSKLVEIDQIFNLGDFFELEKMGSIDTDFKLAIFPINFDQFWPILTKLVQNWPNFPFSWFLRIGRHGIDWP